MLCRRRCILSSLMICLCAILGACPVFAAEPVTIVTLGDSITKGVRAGVKADETFSSQLKELHDNWAQGINLPIE